MIILGIIVAIIVFSIVILIHEWGHFITARKFGVRVEEFGLGLPPRAKKLFRDKKGTLFSLNRLPLGGFVKLTGEQVNTFNIYNKSGKKYNNEQIEKIIKSGEKLYLKNGTEIQQKDLDMILQKLEDNKAEYNLANKAAWKQSIIILAGIFMNFALAIFIFSALFFFGVKPIGINTKIPTNLNLKLIPTYSQAIENKILIIDEGIILQPLENSIAKKSGIKPGDILIKVNGIIIKSAEDVKNIVSQNKGKQLIFTIKNKNNLKEIEITPSTEGKIGSYLSENVQINNDFKYKYSFLESIKYGTIETYSQIMLTFKGIGILGKKIFTPEKPEDREEALNSMSGPIGIVDFISNSIGAGIIFVLIIGAIISINLGVFNLLPIPALDGGRFVFITLNGIIKKIIGKKAITENVEGFIHVFFFVILIALSLFIGYNDIIKIVER